MAFAAAGLASGERLDVALRATLQIEAGNSIIDTHQNQWTAVDQYICDHLVDPDPVLEEVLQSSAAAGLPPINVSPNMGRLLEMLARLQGSRSILEIGTLAGYSTIWLARALPPGGRLVTLESDPERAAVARENIARAGLDGVVQLRLGLAADTLSKLVREGRGPFDLIFVDADKRSTPDYLGWALKLARRGSLIVVDNVVRSGAVIDAGTSDPHVQGVRTFYKRLAAEPRTRATAIQTVGVKGYDGFAMALVTDDP